MCVYSMMADHYKDWLPKKYEWIQPVIYPPPPYNPQQPNVMPIPTVPPLQIQPIPTREEFDKLKEDVEEMKRILKLSKDYDDRTNQPDCEIEEKVELLRKIAKIVGVNLEEIKNA